MSWFININNKKDELIFYSSVSIESLFVVLSCHLVTKLEKVTL